MSSDTPVKRSMLTRSLDGIEAIGNKLPDPLTLFVGLALLMPIISWLVSMALKTRSFCRLTAKLFVWEPSLASLGFSHACWIKFSYFRF